MTGSGGRFEILESVEQQGLVRVEFTKQGWFATDGEGWSETVKGGGSLLMLPAEPLRVEVSDPRGALLSRAEVSSGGARARSSP